MTAAQKVSGEYPDVFLSLPEDIRRLPVDEIGELVCARIMPVEVVGDQATSSPDSRIFDVTENGDGLMHGTEKISFGPSEIRVLNLLRCAFVSGETITDESLRDFGTEEVDPSDRATEHASTLLILRTHALVQTVEVEGGRVEHTLAVDVSFRGTSATAPPGSQYDELLHEINADIDDREERAEKLHALFDADQEEPDAIQRAREAAGLTIAADPVRAYLKEIGKTPLLSAIEEVELGTRIEAGVFAEECLGSGEYQGQNLVDNPQLRRDLQRIYRDGRQAKNHFTEANLRLVVSLAKRYTGRGMEFLDLISEGNVGLIRAVEKFDYNKGYKFSTYATWWIKQAITRSMADQSRTIRIPVHTVEDINTMGRYRQDLNTSLGREPSPEEIAMQMNVAPERVKELQEYSVPPIQLDARVGDKTDFTTLGDLIEDEHAPDAFEISADGLRDKQIESLLRTFSEREAAFIRMRFGLSDGEPQTVDEIAQVLGIKLGLAKQFESRVMSKLQHPSRSQSLVDYLDRS